MKYFYNAYFYPTGENYFFIKKPKKKDLKKIIEKYELYDEVDRRAEIVDDFEVKKEKFEDLILAEAETKDRK